jgi:hypothetical protein
MVYYFVGARAHTSFLNLGALSRIAAIYLWTLCWEKIFMIDTLQVPLALVGSVGLGVLECKGHLMDLLPHVPYLVCQLMPGGCSILSLPSPRWDPSPQTHNETHLGQLLTYGISSDPDHCSVNVHEHRALIWKEKERNPNHYLIRQKNDASQFDS